MDFYTSIKINGFYHFNDPSVFTYLKWFYKIPTVKYENCRYPILHWPVGRILIRLTQMAIYKKYLTNYKLTFGNVDAWSGIDIGTDKWHNDSIEGSNTAFLLYSCNTTEETGGGIQFRTLGTGKVYTVYPKKYDIIIMDQDNQFQHKVIPLKKTINRNTANVEFNIRGIK